MIGLSCALPSRILTAQTVQRERESTITGPRGRSITRRLEVDRGPGSYERQLQIQRPGGTLQRDFLMQRVPGGGGFGGGGWLPRPMVFERNVFVAPRPATSWSFGIFGAPVLAIPFGIGATPPPPVIGPMPGAGGAGVPPGAIGQGVPPGNGAQASPLDPVVLAAQRLQSHHASSRKDGAQTLGRLGDPRAVPALVHALKYDSSRDVKEAAAAALGEIGGSEAELVLERCIIYEKKSEVRDAAALALQHLRDKRDTATSAPSTRVTQPLPESSSTQSNVPRLAPPPDSRSSPFKARQRSDEPALDGPAERGGESSEPERAPPPPPTPVTPG
jgi:hypothetical protein